MFIPFVLVVLTVAYRVATAYFDVLPNFAPLMALAFCVGIYTTRRIYWLIPLAALLLSDFLLNLHYGEPFFTWYLVVSYALYAVGATVGGWVRQRPAWHYLAAGSLLCSVLFYLATNTVSWWTEPGYAKTVAGWVQALTVGLPGYPQTWIFFRNTLLSDLFFIAAFVLVMEFSRRRDWVSPGVAPVFSR
jgi:hypothetical protein